jgi:outer membrane protein
MQSLLSPLARLGSPRALRGLAAAIAVTLFLAPQSAVLAAGFTDVGYVDQGQLASVRSFVAANGQLAAYKAQLDRQFAAQIRSVHGAAEQQRLAAEFQGRLTDKQREVLGPLFTRAQVAIASVASSKNLSVVVDKRIVIVGGQDITKDVMDLLNGPGEPVPPVSTPPPSKVGYVDQQQIDAVPKLKDANEEFGKYRAQQQQDAQGKLRGAKTEADRAQIYQAFQKSLADKQHQLIDPLVDQTRSAIAAVAQKKGLILVIDKGNIIYGGTDITSDVTSALK